MKRATPWARALACIKTRISSKPLGLTVRKVGVRQGEWDNPAQEFNRRCQRKPSPAAKAPTHNPRQVGEAHAV